MSHRWWVVIVGAGIVSCVTTVVPPPPEPAPPPPPIVVPEGCLELLGGPWVHATEPSFRYLADDDGGTLTLAVERLVMPDAGFSPRRFRVDAGVTDAGAPPDAGASAPPDGGGRQDGGWLFAEPDGGFTPTVLVTLARTPAGFVGHALTTTRHPTGRLCEVRFPTKVLACGDGGLTLETDTAAAIGDACQPPARPQGLTREVHQLVRPKGP